MLATQAPLAEVLTVVRQQPIAILPYPGACPFDHLLGVKIGGGVKFDPHRLAAGESIQRHFFDRSPVQATCETGVMNDPAITHIDSVMQIAAPAGNEVRAQRRLVILRRQMFQASHYELPQVLFGAGKRWGNWVTRAFPGRRQSVSAETRILCFD
jgi:hypothetical protein